MTLSTTINRVSYTGNAATVKFAFPYKFIKNADLKVYLEGTLQTITTDYTVTGAGLEAGGEVEFLSAPGTGESVVILREVAFTQETDLVENDPLPAETMEDALDKLTMGLQQMQETIDRALLVAPVDVGTFDLTLPSLDDRKGVVLAFDETTGDPVAGPDIATVGTVAANVVNINAVGGSIDNVNTVAGAIANVGTVAGSIANVNTVAGAISNVNTVAGSIADVSSVAAIDSDVIAVAAIDTDVSAVAAIEADVTTCADKIAAIIDAPTQASNAATSASDAADILDDFDDRYLGAKASDPALDNDGDALITGALYFNTTDDVMKVYDGANWIASYVNISGALMADGSVPMTGALQMGANGITFDGSTADTYKTTLNVVDPTADRAINLPDKSGTVALTSGIFSGLRNKIVNGCGWIDQQNINAAVTVNSTTNTSGPDKWCGFGQLTDGVFTLTGSKSVFYPAGKGFPSSIYCQTTTADASIGAAQSYGIRHVIEGQVCADWRLGTANAATVKLRFAVRSSRTGTHCVALKNNASDRTYVATYTISSADTWEEKEITIALDTTGTWLTTNGAGIKLLWNLGAGSNYETTANTWVDGNYFSVAGCVNVIGTLNATFAITDVDMRLASDSAIYEYRDYQKELDLCQREYCKTFPMTTAPAQNAGSEGAMNGVNDGITANGYVEWCWQYPVRMRAEPTTVTTYNPLAANSNWSTGEAATVGSSTNDRHAFVFSTNMTASNSSYIHIVADARL